METTVVPSGEVAESHRVQCMEVFGGSQITSRGVQFGGLDTWLFSKPFGASSDGGDVYYASSCINGRISRFLLADVVGHGSAVAEIASSLELLMRRFVNRLEQREFVRVLNRKFSESSPDGIFATAIVATYFAPTRRLSLCNAGHPSPLLYRAAAREWTLLGTSQDSSPRNIPFGILHLREYEHFDIELGPDDCLLLYTDPLMEACGPNREIIGEDGLLELVRGLTYGSPKGLVDALLAEISNRYPAALECDDVTVMLLQASGKRVSFSFAEKWRVAKGYFADVWRATRTGSARPPFPFPGLNPANLGGAVFPPLSKLWRVRRKAQRLGR